MQFGHEKWVSHCITEWLTEWYHNYNAYTITDQKRFLFIFTLIKYAYGKTKEIKGLPKFTHRKSKYEKKWQKSDENESRNQQ